MYLHVCACVLDWKTNRLSSELMVLQLRTPIVTFVVYSDKTKLIFLQ